MNDDDKSAAPDDRANPADASADPMSSVAKRAVDSALQITSAALNKVSAALDKAQAGVENLRTDAPPNIDAVTDRAQRLAAKGRAAAAQAQEQTQQKLREYADKTSAYVAEKPIQSLAIAAGVGAALALLLGGRRRD